MSENKRMIIIDGNSLMNRAYYAIQRPMITKEGVYTQGIYGFLNLLNKARQDFDPAYLVVAFDRKAPTFRHEEYAEYKAGRKKMPPELAMQFPLLKEVLTAMRIQILEMDGFEADDLLGTVARSGEEEGLEPIIITGDRDAFQLATKKTRILFTKKGISEMELYDEDAMYEKYGFSPQQFIDYKGLMGDPSDNIPGLPGVGEKTASKLILEFGSVANLLASTDRISNAKLRAKIEDNAQLALMSRRLAEINRFVPVEWSPEDSLLREPDHEALIALYTKLEFTSFLKKLKVPSTGVGAGCAGEDSGSTELKPGRIPERPKKRIVEDGDLDALEEELKNCTEATLHVQSDGNHADIPSLEGLSILTDSAFYYIRIKGTEDPALSRLRDILKKCEIRWKGYRIQQDYYALFCNGWDGWNPETGGDPAIGQYLLEPGRTGYDIHALSLEYLHEDRMENADPAAQEAGEQIGFLTQIEESEDAVDEEENEYRLCVTIEAVWELMKKKLEGQGLLQVLREVELPLAAVLADMEMQGMPVDRGILETIGKELTEDIQRLTGEIYELAGETFNINSPKQLGVLLFEKLGLPAGKKTKSGYSTNAEVLEGLRKEHPVVEAILEYRSLTKLNGTYVEGLIPLIHKDGRIHAHFQPTVAATGRISCTEPNLQNIPVRQEQGRRIRKAFLSPAEDWSFMGADYSQIELRVLAHMAGDQALLQAFKDGADIHRSTAARIFGVAPEAVTPSMRSGAKAINFGVIYGMSSFRLSNELHIPRKEAEAYIEGYFATYPRVKEFMEEQIEKAKKDGSVLTILNRKRPIPEIHASSYQVRQLGERLAMNSPIQGSAADIIKLAMIACHKALREKGMRSKLVLQIHDELILLVHREEREEVEALLREAMERVVDLNVELSVDLNTGSSWYDLK